MGLQPGHHTPAVACCHRTTHVTMSTHVTKHRPQCSATKYCIRESRIHSLGPTTRQHGHYLPSARSSTGETYTCAPHAFIRPGSYAKHWRCLQGAAGPLPVVVPAVCTLLQPNRASTRHCSTLQGCAPRCLLHAYVHAGSCQAARQLPCSWLPGAPAARRARSLHHACVLPGSSQQLQGSCLAPPTALRHACTTPSPSMRLPGSCDAARPRPWQCMRPTGSSR
jgi:hypothetical protein